MIKTTKLFAALLLSVLLTVSILLPAFASPTSHYLSASSAGATLTAGSTGYIPFSITYPSVIYSPGMGYIPGSGIGAAPGLIANVAAALEPIDVEGISLLGESYIPYGQFPSGRSVQGNFAVSVTEDVRPVNFNARITVTYNVYTFTADPNSPTGGSLSQTPTAYTLSLEVPVTVVNPKYEALTDRDVFSITRREIPDRVAAGDTFTASLTLKNLTAYALDGVTVSLDAPDCYFHDDTGTKTLDLLPNGTARASFNLKAVPGTAAGSRQIKATVSYLNPAGKTISRDFYMLLNIEASPATLPADVRIIDFSIPEKVKAGESFYVNVTVQNVSDRTAESLTLSLSQEGGLHTKSASKLTIPTLEPNGTATLSVEYAAPIDSAASYCLFTAECVYATRGVTERETVTQDNGVYISERDKPVLEVTSLSIPESVKAGEDFTLSVTLRNIGGAGENLFFSISPDSGFVYKSSTSQRIKTLAPGGSVTLSFILCATDSMTEGYKSIRLTCTTGDDTVLDEYTGTVIKASTAVQPQNDVPVIIIASYDYGDEVFGGQTFTLNLQFRNTSKTTAAKDLKITVSSSAGDGITAFTPANSSNTFFIEELLPQTTVTQSIDLLVKGDLAPKSYGISVHLEYKNATGTAGESADETLAIPVKQEVRFNIGEISSLTDITTMEEAYLTATFGNLGKSTIYNVIVKVEGEGFSCYSPEYYAGNIEAGKHLSYDFYLTPNGPGFATGKLTYTYEDANGETFTETQEFSFNINESMNNPMGGSMMEMPMEPIFDEESGYFIDPMTGGFLDPETMMPIDPAAEDGMPLWGWIAIGGAVVLAAILIPVTVIRVRRRKQEEDDADL